MHTVITHAIDADLVIEFKECATNYHRYKRQLAQVETFKRADSKLLASNQEFIRVLPQSGLAQTSAE